MRIYASNKINELTLETYIFCCLITPTDSGIYLEEYTYQTRESKKALYKIDKCYYRLPHKPSSLFEKDVPITDDIKNQVLNKIIFKLEFRSLKDRKGKGREMAL